MIYILYTYKKYFVQWQHFFLVFPLVNSFICFLLCLHVGSDRPSLMISWCQARWDQRCLFSSSHAFTLWTLHLHLGLATGERYWSRLIKYSTGCPLLPASPQANIDWTSLCNMLKHMGQRLGPWIDKWYSTLQPLQIIMIMIQFLPLSHVILFCPWAMMSSSLLLSFSLILSFSVGELLSDKLSH